MKIEEKYEKLLGKLIYNKSLNKHGRISSFEYVSSFGDYCCLSVHYDSFDDRSILFLDDFEKGNIQFVMIESWPEKLISTYIEDIKFVLEDKFREDMIIYMTADEWNEHLSDQEKRNIQTLNNSLVSLTEISAKVMAHDFHCRELYMKYKNDVLTERELLFALVNHLSQEYQKLWDMNGKYFFKYEFPKQLEEMECDT